MSVLENLELGAFVANARKAKDSSLKWVYEIFPRLEEREGNWQERSAVENGRCSPLAGR